MLPCTIIKKYQCKIQVKVLKNALFLGGSDDILQKEKEGANKFRAVLKHNKNHALFFI